jgi:hypothetical protein
LRQRGLFGMELANDAAKSETASFVQVTVDDGGVARMSIEVVLAKGRRLRVRPGFDANTLRQLLRVLEESTC